MALDNANVCNTPHKQEKEKEGDEMSERKMQMELSVKFTKSESTLKVSEMRFVVVYLVRYTYNRNDNIIYMIFYMCVDKET